MSAPPHSDKKSEFFASREAKDVCLLLGSSPNGLSTAEAERRLKAWGRNAIAEKKEMGLILEFLSHFKSPLILILLMATAVAALFHETMDAIIIGVIVLLSVFLDFFLEHSADKAAKKLQEQVKTQVTVLRDHECKEVSADELCVGDVVQLRAGSIVPADARILAAKDFFVNQSSLTGESFPSQKRPSVLRVAGHSATELANLVFGTNVISGSATAVVVKTGESTEFGRIVSKLQEAPPETEFDKGIRDFGYLILKATIFLVLFIFLFNSLVKHNYLQSFLFSLAVAVGLTPELLPMIMSVTMAKGSLSMAKQGVIVKRLASIPNFGSMDVLCTDKTGTLTQDKIKLVKYTDVFGKDSERVLQYAYLNSLYQTGIRNPLDDAVLEFRTLSHSNYRKVDEIPFDFVRKKMSVVVETSGKRFLVTKGAPEEVLESCKYYSKGSRQVLLKNFRSEILKQYDAFSRQGYRVLAVAMKPVVAKASYDKQEEIDLELLGFVSFLDPPKDDIKEVLKELTSIGIEIKIITGDNELVTKKICDDIDLPVKGVLLGKEVSTLSEESLKVRVEKTTIFARFSPDEKNRVIHALRSNNHVVGYMGDGINDSPSLRAADIGISVNTAVDVAKESATIVLTRKSLRVLKDGILEGRKTFGNTMKYIMMGLSSNFGNMFSVAIAVLWLPFLPMLPVQILLNNFIYDFAQITIPSDSVDDDFVRKPKRWNLRFIKKFMFVMGPVSSIFDLVTFGLLYWVFHLPEQYFQTGWFIESLATQTMVIFVIRTKKTPFLESSPSKYLLVSSLLCVAFGWGITLTPLGHFFGFVGLPFRIMMVLAGVVLAYLCVVEVVKRFFYRRYDF